MEEIDKITWNIIDKLFKDNPNLLVKHHLDSFNKFFNTQIFNIFREKNPIKIVKDENADTKEFNYQAEIYIGGRDGTKLHYGKPIIFDEREEHFMYPNEARLRNMTYGITIHYDVDIEYFIRDKEALAVAEADDADIKPLFTRTFEKIFLATTTG